MTNKIIRIYADSRQALLILSKYRIVSRSVWECHAALMNVAQTNTKNIRWAKGYGRCYSNRIPDELTKRAVSLSIHGPFFICLASGMMVQMLKEDTNTKFIKVWYVTDSCQFAKEKYSMTCLSISRNHLHFVTGILTGHCELRTHLHEVVCDCDCFVVLQKGVYSGRTSVDHDIK